MSEAQKNILVKGRTLLYFSNKEKYTSPSRLLADLVVFGPTAIVNPRLSDLRPEDKLYIHHPHIGIFAVIDPFSERPEKLPREKPSTVDLKNISKRRLNNAIRYASENMYLSCCDDTDQRIESLILDALKLIYIADKWVAEGIKVIDVGNYIKIEGVTVLKTPIEFPYGTQKSIIAIDIDEQEKTAKPSVPITIKKLREVFKNSTIKEIPINNIEIHKRRAKINRSYMSSIRDIGAIYPVIVEEKENGKYELIDGEGRITELKKAKEDKVRALVLKGPLTETEKLTITLIANFQRTEPTTTDLVNMVKVMLGNGARKREIVKTIVNFTNISETQAYRIVNMAQMKLEELAKLVDEEKIGTRHMDEITKASKIIGEEKTREIVKKAIKEYREKKEKGEKPDFQKILREKIKREQEKKTTTKITLEHKEREEFKKAVEELTEIAARILYKIPEEHRRKLRNAMSALKEIEELVSSS